MAPDCELRFQNRAAPSLKADNPPPRLAVVIPSFRASETIGAVLGAIGPEIERIYVVDDVCPDATVKIFVRSCAMTPRVSMSVNPRGRLCEKPAT